MTVLGIGTDLVEIERVAGVCQRMPERFPARILTVGELAAYRQHHDAIAYLAKRFAAKEAVAKAFGTGIGGKIGFEDIVIANTGSGQPVVELLGRGLTLARSRGVHRVHLSLSDERQFALAFVLLEGA